MPRPFSLRYGRQTAKGGSRSEQPRYGCTDQALRRDNSFCQLGAVHTWRVSILRQRARQIGVVEAPNEKAAQAAAGAHSISTKNSAGGYWCWRSSDGRARDSGVLRPEGAARPGLLQMAGLAAERR